MGWFEARLPALRAPIEWQARPPCRAFFGSILRRLALPTEDIQKLVRLLGGIALHDQQAFKQLYDQVSPKLFAIALRILRDRGRAEEVLQDAFVNVWNSAASYNPSLAAPMTWLITIVRNRSLDYMRRIDRAEVELDDDLAAVLESDVPGPQHLVLRSEDAAALSLCLARLDAGQRQAIAFSYFQGLSHSELAANLQVPIGTVKTWIRRGLEKLRRCLEASA
jgi:RNA polymerase sigma-70 factor (ECF subfamily)